MKKSVWNFQREGAKGRGDLITNNPLFGKPKDKDQFEYNNSRLLRYFCTFGAQRQNTFGTKRFTTARKKQSNATRL